MTTKRKEALKKRSLLKLATEMNNVSKACKIMGYSRQQFYEIRRNYQTYGSQGLIDLLLNPKGPHSNRVDVSVKRTILEYSLEQPPHGPLMVTQQLALRGVQVSSGGVRGVWGHHNLLCHHERLLRLEWSSRELNLD